MRSKVTRMTLLLVIAGTHALYAADAHGPGKFNPAESVLYIWAGDQARVAPDFLAVVNFDEKSENEASATGFCLF
jgi:hypothetical protein